MQYNIFKPKLYHIPCYSCDATGFVTTDVPPMCGTPILTQTVSDGRARACVLIEGHDGPHLSNQDMSGHHQISDEINK